ncbi:MAG: aromatic ring-hydroxylating dioxygenase subunit alpha [Aromatoleum sp.]|jgi:p-cumate 2,3-dioxygenase alpha subunit|uniref:aromatic ring-hydroxylating oxygenase subunit alpha n=1 Tax=Aromatoleum sp. TaxID=2307007 RepID=UPI002895CBB3|nr:aromatic ring-hydroxylating dioxygenase subunit alpha [Aromatoleum sp.]MDT3670216.1 aromatic ring-hydroxylating dioxygenase subunit alpha [Aromatoleum sp.]
MQSTDHAKLSDFRFVDRRPEAGVFRVHRSAYKSPEVFELEKERIFSKCWLYVGHESEVAKKNDYVARRVGGRELVFLRDREGKIRAHYNSCTHRGPIVVREPRGNRKSFTCEYHGWVFNNTGKLMSFSADSGYRENQNCDGRLNLTPVERLEDYRGFYFVNFNPKAISLYDYLDGARDAFDQLCEQAEDGLEVLQGELAYSTKANYKYLMENSYDGYHVGPTHATYVEYLLERVADNPAAVQQVKDTMAKFSTSGRTRMLGNGHALLESNVPTGRPVAQWTPAFGAELKPSIDAKYAWLQKQYGPERADYIANFQKNLIVFPNLVINDIHAITIRVVEPVAHDSMRVIAWALAPKNEDPALRKLRLDNFISFLGPAGFGSPDDIEMLELCQQGIEGTSMQWSEYSKGFGPQCGDSLKGEGGPDDEVQIQAYWTQWDRVVRGLDTLEVKD